MRVFVAGATGAIGRPLIPQLIAAGHHVVGMTRAADRAEAIRASGAGAVVSDVFDREGLHGALADARPEVVVHQLTALPGMIDPRREATYAATNRLRTEGTRLLLEAAGAAGARRVVAQSIAFMYAPTGAWVKTERDPVLQGVPGPLGGGLEAIAELEGQVLAWDEGLVLRYGFFYGPGTSYASAGPYAEQVRRRRLPIVGTGTGVFSFVHVDDAAGATVAAVERGAGGIYNVADDDPAPLSEWLPEYAAALGARRPFRIPKWIARLAAGSATAGMFTNLRGASNAKAKAELGWEPAIPSWRQGFREALG